MRAGTKSFLPLIFGIIGGVFGIVGGLCTAACGEFASAANELVGDTGSNGTLIALAGYGLIAVSVLALIFGCIARSVKSGSLLQLIFGIIAVILVVLSFVGLGLFDPLLLIGLGAPVMFIIGGSVGMAGLNKGKFNDNANNNFN